MISSRRAAILSAALLITAACLMAQAPAQAPAGTPVAPPLAPAGPRPAARARADSSSYLVGDWITMHVDMVHPKGAVLRPALPDSMGGFLVLQRNPPVRTSDTTSSASFIVSKYDSGAAQFPPVEIAVTVPGDTTVRLIATNPVMLTVRTVPVDTSKDIRDLKPPLSIPISLAEILWWAGGILAAGALAYFLWRYWKRWKARKAAGESEYVPPARPAHEIAFEQLALLRQKKLWQQGLVKQYYTEATEIFRRYLENRYRLQAMEEVTDEILTGLRKLRFPDGMLETAERILRRADLVKFAKFEPGIADHEEMITVIHDFVDKTKIMQMMPVVAPSAPAPEANTKAAAHAVD